MRTTRTMTRAWAVWATLTLSLGNGLYSQIAPPALIGRWQGIAEMVGSWPKQRTLHVDVIITRDDSVHGMIGDAMLVQGRLLADRQLVVVPSRWNTEYVAVGLLNGPVIRAANIWRTSVQLMFNLKGDSLQGGVSTTGVRVLGIEQHTVDARVTLRRVSKP